MSGNASDSQAQGLEQTMSTVFACRSVVKYNMALSAEQKDELIAEIDTSLQFLRDSLITHASDQITAATTSISAGARTCPFA
jgi:hypothetical protein